MAALPAELVPIVAVAVPLTGALASLLAGPRLVRAVSLAASLATSASAALAVSRLEAEGVHYRMGGWAAPLGIELALDGLAGLMLLATALVGLAATGYALARAAGPPAAPAFWPLWFLLWAGLNALFLSADIFNLYVTLELVTIASVGLIATSGGPAIPAAFRYLLWATAGSLAYLLGVALLFGELGRLDLAGLAELGEAGFPATAAVALMTAGLALKAALFPLHFWLPPAHSSAAPAVSAMLSGLVVMAGFYGLLRLWTAGLGGMGMEGLGTGLGGLGTLALLWGAVQAFRQERLKLLVAYSTVAQIGYFFLCFALGRGWTGAVYLAISHACAKGALFLGAGAMTAAVGHDRVRDLSGVSSSMPVALFAVGLAGVTLVGLPPTGGFVGKWLLLEAAIAAENWWVAGAILLGSLAAAGYVFRVIAACFGPAPAPVSRPASRPEELWALALALVAVGLGLGARPLLELLATGAPFGPGGAR